MYALILTAACGLVPHDPIVDDRADVIEVNYFYDHDGRFVFGQVIFWQWRPEASEHRVIAWRMLKSPRQIPLEDFHRGGHQSVWVDGGTLRRVRSLSARTTWTQHDPELLDRRALTPCRRSGLSGEKQR